MANEELGTLSFASFVRRGLAAGLTTPDAASAGAPQNKVAVHIDFDAGDISADVSLSPVEPGDVVGLDPRVIVRARPKPDDNDAEYQHFALIELDQADLPWRYTPAAAAGDRLRPWLALVVVKESEAGISPPTGLQKLPVLTVKDVGSLPDATQAWAWAHTQLEGTGLNPSSVATKIEGQPGLFVARLISPRILEASTPYIAALVPTFERGRKIGLGLDPGFDAGAAFTDAFTPAWSAQSSADWPLPVYYSWRFQTGTVGSFEQLARLIVPKTVPASVGRRDMDVHAPGLNLPDPATTPLGVEGALQSVQASDAGPTPWPATEQQAWVTALKQFINTPILDGTRVVAPPLYAQWYAAESEVNAARPAGTNPPWFFDLNTDPRARVGGALGTTVIQREQQALLRGGWTQVGDLPDINNQLRILQLGREAWIRIYERHLVSGSLLWFFTSTAKLHARVQCGTRSVCDRFDTSIVGNDLLDPQWRRWTSMWGWLGRRQRRPFIPLANPDIMTRINNGQRPAPEPGVPDGTFTQGTVLGKLCPGGLPDGILIQIITLGPQVLLFWGLLLGWIARELLVSQKGDCWWLAVKLLRFAISLVRCANSETDTRRRIAWCEGTMTPIDVTSAPPAPGFTISTTVPSPIPSPPRPGGPGTTDSAGAAGFRSAIAVFVAKPNIPVAPLPPAMDLSTCRVSLTAGLDPRITVGASILSRLAIDASVTWKPEDPLEPLFAPPAYEQPMYRPLADVSKDWILPGLDQVPRDTAGLVLTNQRFVEAYMAGLNHEMTRELLWNEFPTDQRGTYFRQFWDQAGHVPPAGSPIPPDQLRDVKLLAEWGKTAPLGGNSARRPLPNGSTQHLVLLVRAQLIKRYPNLIVYASEAKPSAQGVGLTGNESHPVFYGLLNPDVAFYGFELTKEQVRGDPGWFFILQEQPGEPRFQDVSNATTFSALGGYSGSSQVAVATYQVPFRLGIHGSMMLPPG